MPRSPESIAAEHKFAKRLIVAGLCVVALGLMFGCAGGTRTVRIPRPSPPRLRGPIRF